MREELADIAGVCAEPVSTCNAAVLAEQLVLQARTASPGVSMEIGSQQPA